MADPRELCRSAIWEHIGGWEVVTTVLIVVAGWTLVQVSRLYFMTKAVRSYPPEELQ